MPATIPERYIKQRCGLRLAPLLCALVAAAGCATTRPRSYPAFVFEGSEANLVQLVDAARACGLSDAAITRQIPGGPLVVLIDIPSRTDARFDCTMRWIGDHPEAGFFQDR
jgi:hypothetical protein